MHNSFGFSAVTEEGALIYLQCYIEMVKGRIAMGDLRTPLYNEQVAFFGKAVEMLKKYLEKG